MANNTPAAPGAGAGGAQQVPEETLLLISHRLQHAIAELLPKAEQTNAALAEGTGLSEPTIKALRAGKAGNPTVSTLQKLSRHLGLPPEYWVAADHECILRKHLLQRAMREAGVEEVSFRGSGLDALTEGLDAEKIAYLRTTIDMLRRDQGLPPAPPSAL